MKFSYTGKKGGRTVKGTIDAPDRKGASNKLRAQGVSVNNLTKASALSGDLKLFGGKAKIKPITEEGEIIGYECSAPAGFCRGTSSSK